MIVRLRAVFYPLVQYLSFFFEEFPERSWTVVAFPCFTVDKSFTSWYALLQLFFLRLSSISLHCTSIQFSFAFCVRSGKKHFPRHSEKGKKTGQTEKEVGRQHHRMDRSGVCQVPEASGEENKMGETGFEVLCGAPTTPMVKGLVKEGRSTAQARITSRLEI